MYLCSEGSARHEFLVEGDVDDVIGALQGNEADDEPRWTLGVNLGRDIAAPGADGDFQVTLTCEGDNEQNMLKLDYLKLLVRS